MQTNFLYMNDFIDSEEIWGKKHNLVALDSKILINKQTPIRLEQDGKSRKNN